MTEISVLVEFGWHCPHTNLPCLSYPSLKECIMSRCLIVQSLTTMLFLLMASKASSDNLEGHIVIPLPMEIIGNIVSEKIPDDVSFEAVIDQEVVQKRETDVAIYFAYQHASEADSINHLIETQLKPLMLSIVETTGLGFERAYSLSEANMVIIFAEKSSDVGRFLDLEELKKWFGAKEERNSNEVETVFREVDGACLRFSVSPENVITRAVGFVSNTLSEAEQEKCLARAMLFGIGLAGDTDSPLSAKSPGTSSRSIGVLDEMALGVLYRDGVEPGMTLRQALSK
jgi:hypothetical protein